MMNHKKARAPRLPRWPWGVFLAIALIANIPLRRFDQQEKAAWQEVERSYDREDDIDDDSQAIEQRLATTDRNSDIGRQLLAKSAALRTEWVANRTKRSELMMMRDRAIENEERVNYAGPVLLLGISGWVVYGRIFRRRVAARRAAGLCVHCGYDLRATPERCPECGAAADRG